jgi:glycosyltransferase involved in cell wall biosynthesis
MRILILSLYYKPLNNIASTRITAFKKYLEELGHHVDVLTRHYSESQLKTSNLSIAMTEGNDFEGDYYKKGDIVYTKYSSLNSKKKLSNKLPKGIRGLYNLYQFDIFHYSYVEYGLKAYDKEFSNNPHDVIIASSPPSIVLSLAKELNLKYNIPWIADFRDSFILSEDTKKVKAIKKIMLNKMLKNSSGISFVSEGMKQQNLNFFNNKNKQIPNTIVYNGFIGSDDDIDIHVIEKFNALKQKYKKVLLYTGSIYKERNLDFFLESLVSINDKSIAIVCIGIQDSFKKEIIKKYGNKINLNIFGKTNYATSIQLQNLADFLLLTIWKNNYTGFSGKIFEYLNANTPIILDKTSPKDLQDFLKDYNNIIYCDENKSVFQKAMIENFNIIPLSEKQKEQLSRKYQVKKLDTFINTILN